MTQLSLSLFGPPRVALDGNPIHIARRKATALLAYLAVSGQSHSRDWLATLLWPESDQSKARGNLRRILSEIKGTLGESWLEIEREQARLRGQADLPKDQSIWLDVVVFQENLRVGEAHNHPGTALCPDCLPFLEAAVALYQDDFMAGFSLKDCPAYDEWQFFQAEEFRGQLTQALVRLSGHAAAAQDYNSAIGYARRWLALDPLHEPAHQQLMALYDQSGQRSAALRQYRRCLQVLERELGVPPSQETTTLYERIQSGDLSPDHPGAETITPVIGDQDEVINQVLMSQILPAGTVTFLFTDIQGSTPLWESQPEKMAAALKIHNAVLRQAIAAHGGRVFKTVGDSFQAAFVTAPQALDAAIQGQRNLRETSWNELGELKVRMGLHTGKADLDSDGDEYAVSHTKNRVARIMSAAYGGQVLLSLVTAELLRGHLPEDVNLEDLGEHQLKGLRHPEQLYQVRAPGLPQQSFPPLWTGATQAEPQQERPAIEAQDVKMAQLADIPSHLPSQHTPFFGRERELGRLADFLARSRASQVQAVFISGDPGCGKTALMTAFAQKAMQAYSDLVVVQGNCNAFSGVGDPYLPFREVLNQLTGDVTGQYAAIPISNQQAQRLWARSPGVIQQLVQHSYYLVDRMIPGDALLGRAKTLSQGDTGWLNTLQDAIDRARAISSELPRSALLEQYASLLRVLGDDSPVLLLLDDLQWVDQSSLHLLAYLSQRLQGARVCLVCAFRPEEVTLPRDGERHPLVPILNDFKRRFGEITIDLQKTNDQTGRLFLDALLDSEPNQLGLDFRDRFFERTQGHPLFTVELLRAMQNRGDLVRDPDRGWVEGQVLRWDHLPTRVEAVIAERVDRLDDHLRGILAVASIEGEVFTTQVIAQVEGLSERTLYRALTQELAVQHQLVRETGDVLVGGQYLGRYRFAHALFQEYFYQGLGTGERRLLHGEVATALETLYIGQTNRILAELAHHFIEAGWIEQAIIYLQKAGDAASAQYANDEAVSFYSQALELVPKADLGTQFDLLEKRIAIYELQGKRDLQAADISRMEQIARGLENPIKQATAAKAKGELAEQRGDYQGAIQAHEQAFEKSKESGDRNFEGYSLRNLGKGYWYLGKVEKAISYYEQALAIANESGDRLLEGVSLGSLGLTTYFLGQFEKAIGYYQQALTIAKEIGDWRLEGERVGMLGRAYKNLGQVAKAIGYYEQALAIAKEIGDRGGEGEWLGRLGTAYTYLGSLEKALVYYEQALAIAREISDRGGEGLWLNTLGFTYHSLGQVEKALGYWEKALVIAQGIGNLSLEGLSLGNLGLGYVTLERLEKALDYYKQALAIHQEINDQRSEGYLLDLLGNVYTDLEHWSAAQDAFQKTLTLRSELGQTHLTMESRAGLARLALAQGELENTKKQTNLILTYLDAGNSLDGTEYPFRIYLTLYKGLRASEDPRADEILKNAYSILQDRANHITDEHLRNSFIENIPWRREIMALWQQQYQLSD